MKKGKTPPQIKLDASIDGPRERRNQRLPVSLRPSFIAEYKRFCEEYQITLVDGVETAMRLYMDAVRNQKPHE